MVTTVKQISHLQSITDVGKPTHEVDENAYLVVITICIAITMLPFINKLKIGDIEIVS